MHRIYLFISSFLILAMPTIAVQADVTIYGDNVHIGNNVRIGANKVKVNNTVDEDGVSMSARAGYMGGINSKTTYTCTARNPNISVKGNNLTVTIKGNCHTITINGKNNSVIAQQTLQLVESGVNNTISITRLREVYSSGENTSLTYSFGL